MYVTALSVTNTQFEKMMHVLEKSTQCLTKMVKGIKMLTNRYYLEMSSCSSLTLKQFFFAC